MAGQATSSSLKEELGKVFLFPHVCMFILAAKLLAKAVRNNKSIRGFSLGDDEVKISQHADDTTLI